VARDFRFGLAIANGLSDDPVGQSLDAEQAGFDVAVIGDHVGVELAPLPTLAAIAGATTSIRIGTNVLNADVRNPVQLAWEAATLDRLSNGRFELGLGAGHTPQEYVAMGLQQDPPKVRKRRLMESVEIIARLLAGDTVTTNGEFFAICGAHITGAEVSVPILVGGNGAALLEHAGKHADAVGLQGLGRTLEDGHSHTVRWTAEHLECQLDQIRRGAGARFEAIELSALVQVVEVTDDADLAIGGLCERVPGLSLRDAADTPYALIGTVDEIADKLERCRDRWGITYFVVRDRVQFARVIARLRERGR
jgi:probable F420-dependent oxidoreductase